ncbi:MAG: AI-2E family transporter [Taibaiella sp.]|nr:AI-2E family transporter [Taibaiella sp.]
MQTVKLPFYARLAFCLISLILIILLLEQARDIFIPLTFGLLIAILLYPLNRMFINKLRMGRAAAAGVSLVLFLLVVATFFYFLTIQVINFSHDLPDLKVRFESIYTDMQRWVKDMFHINRAQQTSYINDSGKDLLQSAARSVSNLFLSVTAVLLLLVFVFMFTFFILFHRALLLKVTLHLFSVQHRSKVREVIMETKTMINNYVMGLMIEMVIMSVANTALLLIMGVKYAILLGLVAAVLNIIPYIGIYTSIVFTMFVTFANSKYSLALEAGAGLFLLHLVDANILMPRIVGARVKMNPFITIIAVIVGQFVWGIPGMFLFIPITGIIKLICERVDGLEAWGMLIGVDDEVKKPRKKIMLNDEGAKPPPEMTA